MKLQELIKRILFYISVPKCVGCGEILTDNGRPICDKCYDKYQELKDTDCSVCFNTLSRCTCANPFLKKHFIKRTCKIYRYRRNIENDIGNKLIYSLKQDNRQDVIDFLAEELTSVILENQIPSLAKYNYVITSVPRRKSAISHYGYDHAKLLAKTVAKNLGVSYIQLLVSKTKRAQKEVTADKRFANISLDYKRSIDPDICDKHVIIIDDIITSGASMGACATLIRGLGVKEITSACLAIAYKDTYVPFNN